MLVDVLFFVGTLMLAWKMAWSGFNVMVDLWVGNTFCGLILPMTSWVRGHVKPSEAIGAVLVFLCFVLVQGLFAATLILSYYEAQVSHLLLNPLEMLVHMVPLVIVTVIARRKFLFASIENKHLVETTLQLAIPTHLTVFALFFVFIFGVLNNFAIYLIALLVLFFVRSQPRHKKNPSISIHR
jgi:hypothetical protein